MKIELTQGKWAVIDEEDYDMLEQHTWRAQNWGSGFYAVTNIRAVDGRQRILSMHRLLLGLQRGDPREGDHINHDTLDNRRSNLRVCTRAQNQYNYRSNRGASQYQGVTHLNRKTPWQATIQINGKHLYLGVFASEIAAAEAYDAAAKKYFGDFAHLNFPMKGR